MYAADVILQNKASLRGQNFLAGQACPGRQSRNAATCIPERPSHRYFKSRHDQPCPAQQKPCLVARGYSHAQNVIVKRIGRMPLRQMQFSPGYLPIANCGTLVEYLA